MPPETLVPQSAAIQAFAFGLAVGAVLAGALAWAWGWSSGHTAGWEGGHAAGWVKGFQEAGVLERLVALDEREAGLQHDPELRVQAGMRRWREAAAEWNREGRKA